MKRKLVWLIVGSLVVLAMVLASCAPTTTTTTQQPTTTTQQPTVTTTTTTTAPTTTAPTTTTPTLRDPAEPKYGGTFTRVEPADPVRFDEYFGAKSTGVMDYYQDALITGDWTKGPAGTNQFDFMGSFWPFPDMMTGALAESWDLPDPKTIVFHIRKGVHFGFNPDSEASRLVNGRELVAEDVIKSWERWYTNPASYLSTTIPRSSITRMDAPDKYTVVLQWTTTPEPGREFAARRGWAFQLYQYMRVEAPEVAKKYGDARDWRNAVGTGPYFLIDYIPGSMLTFKRNPNYWQFDPFHSENRLPYVETSRVAIIPDNSSRLAALRTGKIDHLYNLLWDDAESLIKTNPELKYNEYQGSGGGIIWFRVDKPEQPWYKQEVRQALTMAIDNEGVKNSYYKGHALYPASPSTPQKSLIDIGAYIPLDKLPADVQELFSYNPTKAKQMLADAGYPNGFKTSVIVQPADSDLAQLVKAYWAAVNVDLEIQIKEPAVYASIYTMNTHPELIMSSGFGIQSRPFNLMQYLPGEFHNHSMYTGPEMAAKALEMDENYFDFAKMSEIYAEFSLHLYRLALQAAMPMPLSYVFWQPWVQNYHGEWFVGNTEVNFYRYIWIDQDLKTQMIGRK